MVFDEMFYRQAAAIVFIALATISVLAGAYIWVDALMNAYAVHSAAAQVSEKLRFAWPFTVSLFLIFANLSMRASGNISVVAALAFLSIVSLLSILGTFYATLALQFLGYPLMGFLALPVAYTAYRLSLLFVRKFGNQVVSVGNGLLERAAFAAIFFAPQPICQFGFFFNERWHLTLP